MKVSYNRLWKLLIDHNMKKKDLIKNVGISTNACSKLSKNELVSTQVLVKICGYFNCNIGDIMDVIENDEVSNNKRGVIKNEEN